MVNLYFVLNHEISEDIHLHGSALKDKSEELVKRFGLMKFAGTSMWGLGYVFDNLNENDKWREKWPWMICEPDERRERHLLDEIMRAGNFGHYDERLNYQKGNRLVLMWRWVKHSLRLFWDYPEDVLWTPIGIVYISMWRRMHRF